MVIYGETRLNLDQQQKRPLFMVTPAANLVNLLEPRKRFAGPFFSFDYNDYSVKQWWSYTSKMHYIVEEIFSL
jgi:hypothetical protein